MNEEARQNESNLPGKNEISLKYYEMGNSSGRNDKKVSH